jgi:uncharacterized protein
LQERHPNFRKAKEPLSVEQVAQAVAEADNAKFSRGAYGDNCPKLEASLKTRAKGNGMASEDRTSKRGFASMDESRQREIAQKGGASVPDSQRSFSKDHALAAAAGRKGGHESGGNFRNDPQRAAEAGRKGGQH